MSMHLELNASSWPKAEQRKRNKPTFTEQPFEMNVCVRKVGFNGAPGGMASYVFKSYGVFSGANALHTPLAWLPREEEGSDGGPRNFKIKVTAVEGNSLSAN